MEEPTNPTPAPDAATPAAAEQPAEPGKNFVPFFNEDYKFRLGALGDLGPALRLTIAFGFMLLTAALLYCATWWWVGIPPFKK